MFRFLLCQIHIGEAQQGPWCCFRALEHRGPTLLGKSSQGPREAPDRLARHQAALRCGVGRLALEPTHSPMSWLRYLGSTDSTPSPEVSRLSSCEFAVILAASETGPQALKTLKWFSSHSCLAAEDAPCSQQGKSATLPSRRTATGCVVAPMVGRVRAKGRTRQQAISSVALVWVCFGVHSLGTISGRGGLSSNKMCSHLQSLAVVSQLLCD